MQLSVDDAIKILSEGPLESLGMLPWSSNYTFLVKATDKLRKHLDSGQPLELYGVYKPRKGEAPLWDFPDGTLCLREQAAYLISRALGWNLVPPTVLRNGPEGFGSVQLFIDNDPNVHYFSFRENPVLADQLRALVAFDLITNNADRKSGHCLLEGSGDEAKLWAIDHGICFNAQHKLRTVIWDFANQPIPDSIMDDLRHVLEQSADDQPLGRALQQLLEPGEVKAFRRRTEGLIKLAQFPSPSKNARSVPWPPV